MSSRMPPAGAAAPRSEKWALARLDAIARLLDSRWRVPGTRIRFGADAVLNLVPGLGLIAAKGASAYLIWEAHRLGAPPGTLLRMVGNVALDALISAIPLAGWFGDVFYRANLRNIALLREHLQARERLPR
jgi:hypothetical protein